MINYHHLGRLGLVLALLWATVPSNHAQSLPFPQPEPATAALADAQFVERARAVIETNACGREDDYLRIRGSLPHNSKWLPNVGEPSRCKLKILLSRLNREAKRC
jgi:hypothetical protein